MKKFLAVVAVALAVVVGQIAFPSAAEAYDYYVGTFNVSRAEGYVMTETIRRTSETSCEARLKAVFPSGQVQYIYYYFTSDDHGIYFSNSDGNRGRVEYYRTPVEYNMYHYIMSNYRYW